jgi:hypothetical protein
MAQSTISHISLVISSSCLVISDYRLENGKTYYYLYAFAIISSDLFVLSDDWSSYSLKQDDTQW